MIATCLEQYLEAHDDPVIIPMHAPFFCAPVSHKPVTVPEWTPELINKHRSVPADASVSAGLTFFDPAQILVAQTIADAPQGTTYGDFAVVPPVLLPDIDLHAASLHCARNGFLKVDPRTLTPRASIRNAQIVLAATAQNQTSKQGLKSIAAKIDSGAIKFQTRVPHATVYEQARAAIVSVITGARDSRTILAARTGIASFSSIARDPDNSFILRDLADIDIVDACVKYWLNVDALRRAQKRRDTKVRLMHK